MSRQSWSDWSITAASPRPIPGHPEGLLEPRAFITCPTCAEKINVAAATAMKNRSLTARQHLKRGHCQTQSQALVEAPDSDQPVDEGVELPPSKRPRSDAMSELRDQLSAMQQQMHTMQQQQHQDKMEIMYTIARAAGFEPPLPKTREMLVEGLRIKMLKYDNMEKQLTCTACMQNPVQALVRPCNHLSLCTPCFHKYRATRQSRTEEDRSVLRCPICRTAADDVWPVSLGVA